jgi:PBP4 family serine-type D-alanyl-D-alanine carboxypeptidase
MPERRSRRLEGPGCRSSNRATWIQGVTSSALAATLVLASVAAPAAEPARLRDRVRRVMDRPEFQHSFFGVAFLDLATERTLYAWNADRFFVPGSTTKLTTTGAALAALGPDHRYRTRVYRTGEVDADGTLDGDLVLVAVGDPNLSARVRDDGTLAFEDEDHSYGGPPVPGDPLLVLRQMADQVAGRGIRRVSGSVRVDIGLFLQGEREGGTGMVLSPVVVNDNLVDVTVEPREEGRPAHLVVSPSTPYVRFVNRVVTGEADAAVDLDFSSDLKAGDGSHTVTLTGRVPAKSPPAHVPWGAPEPDRFAAVALSEALRDRGIRAAPAPPGDPAASEPASYVAERLVAEHVSPTLSEGVKVILKVSQNLHASQLPYVLGAGAAAPKQAGFDRMRTALSEAGLDLSGAAQGDGAGARAHFTPAFMVRYLAWIAKQPFARSFFEALPVLGRDGTLHDIQVGSRAAGHVHAKTGTYLEEDLLNRALFVNGKGLAGYVDTEAGRRLAFCAYLNHVPVAKRPDAIRDVVGQALGEIAAAAYDARP